MVEEDFEPKTDKELDRLRTELVNQMLTCQRWAEALHKRAIELREIVRTLEAKQRLRLLERQPALDLLAECEAIAEAAWRR